VPATNSYFDGISFDWQLGNPRKERRDFVDHYTGDIVCYNQADYESMHARQKAVTVTPVSAGNVYIDYWPPDPTYTLIMYNGLPNQETHLAILVSFARSRKLAGNAPDRVLVPDNTIHLGTADFILLS
jgi:hypothetical protein